MREESGKERDEEKTSRERTWAMRGTQLSSVAQEEISLHFRLLREVCSCRLYQSNHRETVSLGSGPGWERKWLGLGGARANVGLGLGRDGIERGLPRTISSMRPPLIRPISFMAPPYRR